ncbi:S1 RNA-binding domain-containing protein [Halobacteria archaeon AArc-curdl1]|uniref:S1 RNA-binding domain-containing protein n=1 Tax=Natronosalvus hydrolyticus TaxID=2979988 RepID=A0AAP2Z7N7_9EURY|nr:S1 RNA-binding domain-containing protein [Halobacteria archaeon AArc-curdl1]
MGNCIICGKPVDGWVCEFHQEDVAFEFEGTSPSELVPPRYYRGTVDGYADFGLFVDIGDHVTGLLHRSELDSRLESLDLEPGDSVYVQVLDVRDNGNVDLGWSIRQEPREFRGEIIQTADGEQVLPEEGSNDTDDADDSAEPEVESETDTAQPTTAPSPSPVESTSEGGAGAATTTAQPATDEAADATAELNRTTVDAIGDQVGTLVRLEGEIASVRQTSGPTVFELSDETGTVECAAFEEAGVRAYPSVETGDMVSLGGEVERRRGDLQVETEALEILEGEEEATVEARLDAAIEQEARPTIVAPLAEDESVAAVEDDVVEAATTIRRAVMEARPIVVRHSATADGYIAGAAIERAVLPLIDEKHTRDDAVYHYFERRPLEGHVYDMDAATGDVTSMLEARDRHDEQLPLVVLTDAGATRDSLDGYDLLDIYGVDRLVIDDSRADTEIVDAVSVAVSPSLADDEVDLSTVTSSVLAANVAAHVNDDVRGDLEHLPAVSFWGDVPEVYAELAASAGYDETAQSERREAVSLEAYYQSYKDKRELIADLLFDDDGDLAAHVSEQFRDKLETELEAARVNLTTEEVGGTAVNVLDTAAFTHRFNFPTAILLLEELHRRDDVVVTLGVDEDELHVRDGDAIDVRELGEAVREAVPSAGVHVVGGRDGYLTFLSGERDAVREAALEAVGERLN